MRHMHDSGIRAVVAVLSVSGLAGPSAMAQPVSFDRDIRPILSSNCYGCHGPGVAEPMAGLHLHEPSRAVRPGSPDTSPLIQRVTAADAGARMPPPSAGEALTAVQVSLLERWIEEGASFQSHWAFVPPLRPEVPRPAGRERARSPVDAFVRSRLASAGMEPSPAAGRRTLIRRLSLDLTGLPPSPPQVRRFVNDTRPGAYERLVDRLLASPHHGERMAQEWMDAARYADTTGFAADFPRPMWHYRDWIIEAFNSNMPFDRFTVEQLAGDMLPDSTQSQKIATGFHRNSMQALGANPPKEEFRIKGIVDRLDTTGRVWLGLTIACAECHDHKYDPISQREYYRLFAIFNNIPHYGEGFEVHGPRMLADLDDRSLKAIDGKRPGTDMATLRARLAADGLLTAQVMVEMDTPRQTHVHVRGSFESKGERVSPGIPAILGRIPDGERADRLGFARSLVDGENPLVARVFANRLWQQFFGSGLVTTVEDFGNQGEPPSHPGLLDWLAVEFVESGWDIRHIVRLIVTSDTYRQSSRSGEQLQASDPYNRLLARGPRGRLPAEQIRDGMLAVSGLLSPRVGGPSVYPVQPEQVGVFRDATAGRWKTSEGPDRHRRGIYTFWQRMYPYPSLVLFDAPSRERSCVRRARSNTPLQALVLLNDPVAFEAARAFAGRILSAAQPGTDAARIEFAYETALSRAPDEDEFRLFRSFLQGQRERFESSPGDAKAVAGGSGSGHAALPAAELATWTMAASTILALDEAITKQ